MFSFFRRRNRIEVPAPRWADYFTGAEYEKFILTIRQYFENEKVTYVIDDGVVQVDSEKYG